MEEFGGQAITKRARTGGDAADDAEHHRRSPGNWEMDVECEDQLEASVPDEIQQEIAPPAISCEEARCLEGWRPRTEREWEKEVDRGYQGRQQQDQGRQQEVPILVVVRLPGELAASDAKPPPFLQEEGANERMWRDGADDEDEMEEGQAEAEEEAEEREEEGEERGDEGKEEASQVEEEAWKEGKEDEEEEKEEGAGTMRDAFWTRAVRSCMPVSARGLSCGPYGQHPAYESVAGQVVWSCDDMAETETEIEGDDFATGDDKPLEEGPRDGAGTRSEEQRDASGGTAEAAEAAEAAGDASKRGQGHDGGDASNSGFESDGEGDVEDQSDGDVNSGGDSEGGGGSGDDGDGDGNGLVERVVFEDGSILYNIRPLCRCHGGPPSHRTPPTDPPTDRRQRVRQRLAAVKTPEWPPPLRRRVVEPLMPAAAPSPRRQACPLPLTQSVVLSVGVEAPKNMTMALLRLSRQQGPCPPPSPQQLRQLAPLPLQHEPHGSCYPLHHCEDQQQPHQQRQQRQQQLPEQAKVTQQAATRTTTGMTTLSAPPLPASHQLPSPPMLPTTERPRPQGNLQPPEENRPQYGKAGEMAAANPPLMQRLQPPSPSPGQQQQQQWAPRPQPQQLDPDFQSVQELGVDGDAGVAATSSPGRCCDECGTCRTSEWRPHRLRSGATTCKACFMWWRSHGAYDGRLTVIQARTANNPLLLGNRTAAASTTPTKSGPESEEATAAEAAAPALTATAAAPAPCLPFPSVPSSDHATAPAPVTTVQDIKQPPALTTPTTRSQYQRRRWAQGHVRHQLQHEVQQPASLLTTAAALPQAVTVQGGGGEPGDTGGCCNSALLAPLASPPDALPSSPTKGTTIIRRAARSAPAAPAAPVVAPSTPLSRGARACDAPASAPRWADREMDCDSGGGGRKGCGAGGGGVVGAGGGVEGGSGRGRGGIGSGGNGEGGDGGGGSGQQSIRCAVCGSHRTDYGWRVHKLQPHLKTCRRCYDRFTRSHTYGNCKAAVRDGKARATTTTEDMSGMSGMVARHALSGRKRSLHDISSTHPMLCTTQKEQRQGHRQHQQHKKRQRQQKQQEQHQHRQLQHQELQSRVNAGVSADTCPAARHRKRQRPVPPIETPQRRHKPPSQTHIPSGSGTADGGLPGGGAAAAAAATAADPAQHAPELQVNGGILPGRIAREVEDEQTHSAEAATEWSPASTSPPDPMHHLSTPSETSRRPVQRTMDTTAGAAIAGGALEAESVTEATEAATVVAAQRSAAPAVPSTPAGPRQRDITVLQPTPTRPPALAGLSLKATVIDAGPVVGVQRRTTGTEHNRSFHPMATPLSPPPSSSHDTSVRSTGAEASEGALGQVAPLTESGGHMGKEEGRASGEAQADGADGAEPKAGPQKQAASDCEGTETATFDHLDLFTAVEEVAIKVATATRALVELEDGYGIRLLDDANAQPLQLSQPPCSTQRPRQPPISGPPLGASTDVHGNRGASDITQRHAPVPALRAAYERICGTDPTLRSRLLADAILHWLQARVWNRPCEPLEELAGSDTFVNGNGAPNRPLLPQTYAKPHDRNGPHCGSEDLPEIEQQEEKGEDIVPPQTAHGVRSMCSNKSNRRGAAPNASDGSGGGDGGSGGDANVAHPRPERCAMPHQNRHICPSLSEPNSAPIVPSERPDRRRAATDADAATASGRPASPRPLRPSATTAPRQLDHAASHLTSDLARMLLKLPLPYPSPYSPPPSDTVGPRLPPTGGSAVFSNGATEVSDTDDINGGTDADGITRGSSRALSAAVRQLHAAVTSGLQLGLRIATDPRGLALKLANLGEPLPPTPPTPQRQPPSRGAVVTAAVTAAVTAVPTALRQHACGVGGAPSWRGVVAVEWLRGERHNHRSDDGGGGGGRGGDADGRGGGDFNAGRCEGSPAVRHPGTAICGRWSAAIGASGDGRANGQRHTAAEITNPRCSSDHMVLQGVHDCRPENEQAVEDGDERSGGRGGDGGWVVLWVVAPGVVRRGPAAAGGGAAAVGSGHLAEGSNGLTEGMVVVPVAVVACALG